jgi:hypothetical protein
MDKLFNNFNFALLDDPDFREDSVREELVVPLLAALGYSASGSDRIIRSRPLEHPFVYIGTKKQPVSIIPDYLLQREQVNSWILDAKGPNELILSGKNVEQAYSYAIHKDIRVPLYGLCNGKEFILYHVSRWPAVFHANLKDIHLQWDYLLALVGTRSVLPHGIPAGFCPDYGLHLKKSGWKQEKGQLCYNIFVSVPIVSVAKIEDELYAINALYHEDNQEYMVTFDFDSEKYKTLLDVLATDASAKVKAALSKQPFSIHFHEGNNPTIGVIAFQGDRIETNDNESYCPFLVHEFSCP